METSKLYQIMRIARKYYDFNIGQLEIAQEEGISKSTVSRLLKKAQELGFVTVTVNYTLDNVEEIGEQLKQLFNLKDVFIVPKIVDDNQINMQDTCQALAAHLPEYLSDNEVIGVSWGNTLNCLSQYIRPMPVSNIKVVQLNGGVSKQTNPTGASRIVDALSNACSGEAYMFPVPAIVDSKDILDVLKQDSHVSMVLNLAAESEVTIFSVGALSKESILYEVGYLGDEEYDRLKASGAVGDIAAHFFKADGTIADPSLDERVVGLALSEIKKKKYNIGIAVGKGKANALLGALRGGYINVLYADEDTAKEVVMQTIEANHVTS